jgi:hypothetical protein
MLKDLPNRVDSLVGGDVINDQVHDPAPIDYLAMVQSVREFRGIFHAEFEVPRAQPGSTTPALRATPPYQGGDPYEIDKKNPQ